MGWAGQAGVLGGMLQADVLVSAAKRFALGGHRDRGRGVRVED